MDPQIIDKDGNVDWDSAMEIFKEYKKEQKEEEELQFICKKCCKTFLCKNYLGKYPLCTDNKNNHK